MSADNGYIIRKKYVRGTPRFILQTFFASEEGYPDINAPGAQGFDSLHDAVVAYSKLDTAEYPSEYGLRVMIDPPVS